MENDHKELLIGLIGSTFGDLKKLDDSIISQSSTLGRRSEAVKQELAKVVATSFRPQPVAVPTIQQPQPVVQIQHMQQPTTAPVEDTSNQNNDFQLELDFDKKARYIEVVDALHVVEEKVDELDKKLNKIIELLSKDEKETKPRTRKKAVTEPAPEVVPEKTQPVKIEEEKKKVPGI